MKLSQVFSLKSEAGIHRAISNILFGLKSRLLNAAATFNAVSGLASTLEQAGHIDRAQRIREGQKFTDAEKALNTAAVEYATVEAAGLSHGVNITPVVEVVMDLPIDAKQAALAAEASGVDAATIINASITNAKVKFDRQNDALVLAQEALFTVCTDDIDPDVKAETVLKAVTSVRDRMVTYRNITAYLGELTLLKADITMLEQLAAHEAAHEGENDGSVDNALVTPPALVVNNPTPKRKVVKKAA